MRDHTSSADGALLLRWEPAVDGLAWRSHSADIGNWAMKFLDVDSCRIRLAEMPCGTTG